MEEEKIKELEKILGVEFKDKKLLIQALTHRSYLNENPEDSYGNNERLEFLGDAVLELIVSDFLFKRFKEKPEGEMTNLRAALVNEENLSKRAEDISIDKYILLSRGEIKESEKAKKSILADTLEAIIGAIYLDEGMGVARGFVKDKILVNIEEFTKKNLKDFKSRFQEEAQSQYGITPIYKVLKEWGPDHDKEFVSGVFLDDELIAKGKGSSKQEAEEGAAQEALDKLHAKPFKQFSE